MAILSTAKIVGMLSSAKKTGRQVLNAAGEYVSEVVEDFISGFTGQGWKIWEYISGKWKLEIDSIVVRETLTVFELLIQKIRAVKGALCITQASGKIETVELKNGFWHITIEDDMSFVAGDFIRCQSWKDNGLKGYWVEISEVKKIGEKDTILIAASEFTGGIIYDDEGMETIDPALNEMIAPAIADEIVQFGNKTLKNRQSAIYLHADEGGQPAIDVLFGINSKSFSGCTKMRFGGDIPGAGGVKGFYCENGMIKGVDETGHVVYQINPDGSAMFGDGSAQFNKDRSGHIAGGAIKWKWDNTKQKYVCTMQDVVLEWNNLSQEVRDELKGEPGTPGEPGMKGEPGLQGRPGQDGADGVVYELRSSVPFIPVDSDGKAKIEFIDIVLYCTVGGGTPEPYPGDCHIFYTVYHGSQTGSSSSPKNNIQIQTYRGENPGEDPVDKAIINANIVTASGQKRVASITLESVKDGFSSDWLRDWDKNQTLIDGESVVSPKMFSGKRNANGTLTGVFSGRECISIDGVAHTGIFAVVNSKIIFSLDPESGVYKFKGRVEADEGYFKGRIEADEGYFKGKIEAEEGLFKGRIESKEGTFGGKVETSINGKKIIVDPENKCIKMLTSEGLETVCIEFEENNSDEANYGFGKFTLKSYPSGVHTYTAVLTPDSIGVSNIIDDKISMLNPYGYSVTSGNQRIYIALRQNQNGSYIADLYSNAWPTKDSVSTGSVYRENDGTLKVK